MLGQESPKKKQIQYSQGRANEVDDAPSQSERSSDDITVELAARGGESSLNTSSVSGHSEASPSCVSAPAQENIIFSNLQARIVDEGVRRCRRVLSLKPFR
jgi:hypothetical protein